MTTSLCIHGHFYQPPRFDPWLDVVLPEGSAAPEHDWNARITKECYAPLAHARRLDSTGMIRELVNCYAWISFNFGPTLLRWMEREAPETYARILDADRESLQRLGHGNALAQVYHHPILPLATDLDKDLEIAWAVQDFQARFQRMPEGMWLAETAVDLPTLDALARAGIRFTILAPRQAAAVRASGTQNFVPVSEDTLDTSRPYLVRLPQDRTITVFFYHGPISRAVAFERLLENGEQFWQRLATHSDGLRTIATDGESYGHHFLFGEMALAYVIDQARQQRDGMRITNFATFLAEHPAEDEARIHEHSSWSCVHGLERWKTHCGCADGGHPDWRQDWRRPLRRCLNYLKYYVDEHYFRRGGDLFLDASAALRQYGHVLAGSETLDAFLTRHTSGLTPDKRVDAGRLLTMQRLALAGFASCAWFFDDIARIEPLNGLTAARRCMDLLRSSGGPDIESGFVHILEEAQSNRQADWTGAVLWRDQITPRKPSPTALAAYCPPDAPICTWPNLTLTTDQDGARIIAHWRDTGETESLRRPDAPPVLEDRHQVQIAIRRALLHEQELLDASCHAAQGLLPWITAFTEGQRVPQASLALMIPGLAWNWITQGQEPPAEMFSYVVTWLVANVDVRKILERRVETRGAEMARDLPAQEQPLLELIQRTRHLGLTAYWWEAQNIVMALPDRARYLDLCQLLNLSPTQP